MSDRIDLARSKDVPVWQDLVEEILSSYDIDMKGMHRIWAWKAAVTAVREFSGLRTWSYYLRTGSIETKPKFDSGSVAFDADTNVLTLTGATWPADMLYRRLVINSKVFLVDRILSTTTLSLLDPPTEDIADGGYIACLSEYNLPATSRRVTELNPVNGVPYATYISPEEALTLRDWYTVDTSPANYTIKGDSKRTGRMVFEFSPMPSASKRFNFLYYAAPGDADPKRFGQSWTYTTGTAGWNGTTTITGVGTTWDSSMVGQIIRFGESNVAPTGPGWREPYQHQRTIVSVTNATTLVVDSAMPAGAVTGRGYSICDPLDVPPELWDCLAAGAVYQMARASKGNTELKTKFDLYTEAKRRAFSADQAWTSGEEGTYVWMPIDQIMMATGVPM